MRGLAARIRARLLASATCLAAAAAADIPPCSTASSDAGGGAGVKCLVDTADETAHIQVRRMKPMGGAYDLGSVFRSGMKSIVAPVNLALDQPAWAKSVERDGLEPGRAVDGKMSTRWSSQFSDQQWFAVHLGGSAVLSRIDIYWEAACAATYQFKGSADGSSWYDLAGVISGRAGLVSTALPANSVATFVAMVGLTRCSVNGRRYGYSIDEMQVFGTLPAPTPASTPASTPLNPTPEPAPEPTPEPTPAPRFCASLWQQCGGRDFVGHTCCTVGAYCKRSNEWYSQCVPGMPPVPATPSPTPTGPGPAPVPAPVPTPPGSWDGVNMKLTHYWDCNGQGCDAATLQPWDKQKYVSPAGYGPQDPADFGGALYGESMWLTGAASDALSALMGPDDGCCGADLNDGGVGGCGKCALVQNPDAMHPEWTAVVMKKSRCPPWTNGCAAGDPHFDVAAPGFDNLHYSTANVCGRRAGTGFDNQTQSAVLGSWWTRCSSTAGCVDLCDQLPSQFRRGCKLFASWGWTRGDPPHVRFKAVACPPRFVQHIGSLFGPDGAQPAANGNLVTGLGGQRAPSLRR